MSMDADRESPPGLDPPDWGAFRALAHRMVDRAIDGVQGLDRRPAWSPLPDEARRALQAALPLDGIGEDAACDEYLAYIEPYTNGNRHPRFFGWVQGNGVPLAALAEFLAASMNPHMAGFDQSGPVVEMQVLDWLKELVGFPKVGSGILLSGGTMANVTALAVARSAKYPGDYRADGLQARAVGPLVFYGSRDTHGWAGKAAEFLGLGRDAFVTVASDEGQRIDITALREAIHADRGVGRLPVCVVGNAGTINSGAIDPLHALADLCAEEGLWFHIDGAFGALAALSPKYRHLVDGIGRADSLAFDLHKWMYLPFEIGCVLIRDAAAHQHAFAPSGEYIRSFDRGVIRGGLPFASLGIELTRGFKALKAWMCLRAYGVRRFAAAIERNIDDIQAVANRIRASTCLELLGPAPLNIVCFRFHPRHVDEADLDRLNREILFRIQESGVGVLSSTAIDGHFALRLANVNHRATARDLDRLVDMAADIGRELLASGAQNATATRR